MILPEIEYRPVFDGQGNFQGVQIIQGDQRVTISLSLNVDARTSYKWATMREVIDRMVKERGSKS